jgi:hypothetical protein
MIEIIPATNIGIFGPVCSGKTNLLNKWLEAANRYVRFDYTGETLKLNDPTIEHFHDPISLLDRLEQNPFYFRVAYHPGKNIMEHYRWCQRALWVFDTDRWLVMDEFHRVCPQTTKLDEDVETALRLARHNQLGIIGASQRPQDVAKLFVDSCRMCVVYRSQEENFLNACAGHWGNDVSDAVEALRPLIYDDVAKVTKQVPQCVVITRDGQSARVYDFANDSFTPVEQFLNRRGEEENGDESNTLRTNLDEEGEQSNGVPNAEGNSPKTERPV